MSIKLQKVLHFTILGALAPYEVASRETVIQVFHSGLCFEMFFSLLDILPSPLSPH